MSTAQSKADIYLMALEALSKAERKAVINRLLEDKSVREDILDIVLIQQRKERPLDLSENTFGERKTEKIVEL